MRALVLVLLLAVFAAPAQAQEGRRLALLIGNQDYPAAVGRLSDQPRADVAVMAEALTRAGFEARVVIDADRAAMMRALIDFRTEVSESGPGVTAFFYYAGHGASAGLDDSRRNYLLPAHAAITTAEQLVLGEGVEVDAVIELLHGGLGADASNALFVVIDACRNTLENAYGARAAGDRGFTAIEPRPGLFVAFSGPDGALAPDDGVYASALAAEIATPGQFAINAFDRAGRRVAEQRGYAPGRLPVMRSALGREFCFVSCPSAGGDPGDLEARVAFAVAERFDTIAEWEAFLSEHGASAYAPAARGRLAALEAAAAAASRVVARSPVGNVEIVDGAGVSAASARGTVFSDALSSGGRGPEMVVVPAGAFTMGSPAGEAGRQDDEGPTRTVTISAPFAVGRFEVTFDDWAACAAGGSCSSNALPDDEGWGQGRRPVINVSWEDAQRYAAWLSRETGEDYRLLSEAEWEYAARGVTSAGSHPRYSWGDEDPTCSASAPNGANIGACSDDRTHEVGGYRANAFGLHDVHGNVLEWVEDCYHNSYSGAPSDGRVWAGGDCSRRVLRGGSWHNVPQSLRSALRNWFNPTGRNDNVGFRLARTVSP